MKKHETGQVHLEAPPQRHLEISKLQPLTPNARKRTARSAQLIAQSLQRFGPARSIVIDKNNRILAGNGTVEGATQVGIKTITVVDAAPDELVAVRVSHLSPDDELAYALADNLASDESITDPNILAAIGASNPKVTEGLYTDEEIAALAGAAPKLEDVEGQGDKPEPRLKPRIAVKVVVLVDQVNVVEQAIAATGDVNRGDALTKICKAYLGGKAPVPTLTEHDAIADALTAAAAAQ